MTILNPLHRYLDPPGALAVLTAALLTIASLASNVPDMTRPLLIAALYAVMAVVGIIARWRGVQRYSPVEAAQVLAGIHALALLILAGDNPVYSLAIVGLSLMTPAAMGLNHTLRVAGLPLLGAIAAVIIGPPSAGFIILLIGLPASALLYRVLYVHPAAPASDSAAETISASIATDTAELVAVTDTMETEGYAAPAASAEHFAEIATRMAVTVDGLVRSIEAINDVTSQQTSGANEQARVIKLANMLLEDFLQLSERIMTEARAMTSAAQQAADISSSGQLTIQEAIDGMDAIRSQVGAIGETIVKLAQLTRRIDEIITSVSEIATQSNLLALNASIEAARAGTHGRGFAVVADEVRTLAQQSTQAATQVRAILVQIQAAMKDTISATESGMEEVDSGVAKTRQANAVMVQLADNINESYGAINAIYEIIRQQANGLEEMAISIDRIDRITQQNLTSAQTVETVSNNLERLAADLQATMQSGVDS